MLQFAYLFGGFPMNPGTVSILILAAFGFSVVALVAWLRYDSTKAHVDGREPSHNAD
jgi:hypothetical protein